MTKYECEVLWDIDEDTDDTGLPFRVDVLDEDLTDYKDKDLHGELVAYLSDYYNTCIMTLHFKAV